jgi:hypothetical protein
MLVVGRRGHGERKGKGLIADHRSLPDAMAGKQHSMPVPSL